MSLAGSFKGVSVGAKRVYLEEQGLHTLKVLSCTEGKNSKTGAEFFAADLEIVETTSATYKPGMKLSFYTEARGFAYLQRDILRFAAAAFGVDDANTIEDFEEIYPTIIDPKLQSLAGKMVQCRVKAGKNPKYVDKIFMPAAA